MKDGKQMFGRKKKPSCGDNHHYSKLIERSNAIQFADDGYPLRLCLYECDKCGKRFQTWIDTSKKPDDVVVKWEKV